MVESLNGPAMANNLGRNGSPISVLNFYHRVAQIACPAVKISVSEQLAGLSDQIGVVPKKASDVGKRGLP